MFGQNELRDPEEYERKKTDFLKFLGHKLITITDFPDIRTMTKEAFDAHVHIRDKRRTEEQDKIETEERNKRFAKAEEERKIREAQQQNRKAELLKEYPYLMLQENNKNLSSRILATKNIRIELERAFPGLKFSITSDTFSMGDSIDVRYTDGATYQEVNKIVRKYQEGRFDGMTDMYEYNSDPFNNLFGGVKYTNTSRSISNEALIKVAAEMGYELTDVTKYEFSIKSGENVIIEDQQKLKDEIRAKAYDTSFYTKPEISQKIVPGAGNELFSVTYNPDKDGIEIKFPSKPETSVLETLKSNGFRWGKYNKVWYKKASSIPGTDEEKCIYVTNLIAGNVKGDSFPNDRDLETQSYQNFERSLQAESRSERF